MPPAHDVLAHPAVVEQRDLDGAASRAHRLLARVDDVAAQRNARNAAARVDTQQWRGRHVVATRGGGMDRQRESQCLRRGDRVPGGMRHGDAQLRRREHYEEQAGLHCSVPAGRLSRRAGDGSDGGEPGAQQGVVGREARVPLERRRQRDNERVLGGRDRGGRERVAHVGHCEERAAREGRVVAVGLDRTSGRRARVRDDEVGANGVVEFERVGRAERGGEQREPHRLARAGAVAGARRQA